MAFRGLFRHVLNLRNTLLHQKCSSVWRFGNFTRLIHHRPLVVSIASQSRTALTRWTRRYCTKNIVADLRRRAALRFLGPNLASRFSNAPRFSRPGYLPTLALVGFSFLNRHPYNNSPQQLGEIISDLQTSYEKESSKPDPLKGVNVPKSYSNIEFLKYIAKGCNGAVFSAKCRTEDNESDISNLSESRLDENQNQDGACSQNSQENEELVIKCLFNYYVESNYNELIKKFWNEAIPSLRISGQDDISDSDLVKSRLPPHPNIVTIYNVFHGSLPDLPESVENFKSALPQNLYPESFGRSMTLCLIMKRYEMTLSDYLQTKNPSMRVRVMLFTQLLEGIRHMIKHQVAHRDLKPNNILLEDVPSDDSSDACPHLVISDFGCCFAGKSSGMMVPYDCAKDGNAAFQAPEVSHAKSHELIDCSKVDLWAAGILAFEIFGIKDLFDVRTKERKEFPDFIPPVIQRVIDGLMIKDPAQRLDAITACNILNIYLWNSSCDMKQQPKSFLQQLAKSDEPKSSPVITLKENFVKHLNIKLLFDAISFAYPNFMYPVDLREVAQQFPNYNRETLIVSD
ncbi:serine/threonine-protein kinase Pink1, mitochondrial [Octopus bimaculoides]|uniref:non-specific serine/threonine protein kinase n=1 Tax=Octopus bimaculoides TaxID=37653 RepID=A0A0L8GHQ2_OCTBM|nr:serine/threonine-protein kinase Pink1, mitochondrial [Octopus bimaculoides]|eukprot:XP_014780946.1 PREDICTED: serine/threonine-protein kinase PINK1, mitochondrial-like [Octopus bimaculoides]